MASIEQEIQAGLIPVREGEYGAKVGAVEPGGIEFIALSERHGRPLDLFWTWVSPNLEFATIFVGVLGITVFGGSFLSVTLGILVGTALGSLTHAVLSSWGPKFGVPQMVQGRGAFGFFGNILPAGLNAITAGIGWFIVNSVSGAFALTALTNGALPFQVTFTIIVVAQVAVVFFGHNLVHVFERVAFVPLAIIFGLATLFTFGNAHLGTGFNPKAPLAFGGDFGAFMLTAGTALGYAVGWNPYASDFTRYQKPDVNRAMVGFWAGFGIFLSCVVLELMGAALATVAGTKWGPNDIPTAQMVHAMPSALYYLALVCIALGAVAANVLNIYSGSMSFLTVGINIPSHIRRAIVAVGFGVLGLVIGIGAQANVGPGTRYEGFLLLITYWIGAWLGVVLTDYWMRRGEFDEAKFYDRAHANWAGPIAMFVGGGIAIWLFASQSVYVGFVAFHVAQIGDITFVIGFLLSGLLYFVLRSTVFKPAAREAEAPAAPPRPA